ncbi:MAG: 2Fe-2S iron-sulfur cluster binding domain-containing protein [Brevundimonas sp.]|uniref:2Fe-2S iron-sulfur cluster binding domain-containing protein n=1 Tax=Brevundimonas sp. TaxID=1871086 RepID=UPI00271DE9BA|nr:2Fe-2S iron-sulfur cluster binding domain-containing protein [Brevundimonas sp.]MDO9587073.1 2Fe-2S iron-sulfur cluster binding domain-containing protein [Brevundimonas sp.]MDP3657542.1 2Fe-2S iron-sulfur cluster binding domain-containing protein [Brevundimonas sp.]MDZ4109574.1 2Fe-2S iron-sulfur cluster binding domain-containing protein [Brevundimonas sp.]
MATLTFDGVAYEASEGQTVLAALEAAGIVLDNSCRAGVCQSCLVQSLDGDPPKAAQAGLSKALALDGYFMACVCVPEASMAIGRAGQVRQRIGAVVRSLDWLSDTVTRLILEPQGTFTCRAGQFLSLIDPGSGVVRSYSIAGCHDGLIELHIRILPGGRMSSLVASEIVPGYRMTISGPSGACFYEDLDPDRRIVLAGTGTGLAPLWAILNDALAQGHRGPINLYHGALDRSGLYLVKALEALQASQPGFRYAPCIRDETDAAGTDLVSVVTRAETDLAHTTFFLCGDEVLVNRLKRALFLAGVKLDRIHADPFVPAQAKAAA